ncbi:E3 ubiquitin-protein ligase TRIM45-like [Saccostrea cucullata]|uniref:E3 ubiquitin-protein ligase TRIM45-like n=1 Tax=Saccostrea cuccullata TaxID=36930 RepID=UPI002ED33F36
MDPRISAQDMMRCDLCETAMVQMHCDTCLVNLCIACVGKHMISDQSKKHEIVPFKLKKSISLCFDCTSHVKERCRMYCHQCDIPVCHKCINASDQHLGHKLLELWKVVDEKKEKFTKEQIELNKTIYPTYQDIASGVQNRMSQLEKEYGDLSTAITKHGEDWHREIDKLVQELKAEVDVMKSTQLQTLQKHLDEINKTMSDIKDEINTMEMAINTNDLSKLLKVKSNVHLYKNLSQKCVPTCISPKLLPGKIQGVKLSELFGAISSNHLISYEQLLEEPKTVTTIDTGYGYLYNVACLSDEEIWTSGNSNTMKLFSINQGSLLKAIRTKSGNLLTDIKVTKSGDLVYTEYNGGTINTVKNKKIEAIRLQNWKPRGVCSTSSGDLLVTMYNDDYKQTKVVRYSGSTEKQTIQFDDKGTLDILLLQRTNHSVHEESPQTVRIVSLQLMIKMTVSTS